MDTSETYKKSIVSLLEPFEQIEQVKWYEDPIYIKMCKKADEIQREWKPQNGDFYYFCQGVLVANVHQESLQEAFGDDYQHLIWLPRQDQLQDMIDSIETPARIIWCVGCWCNHNKYAGAFRSMEQVWLAFVMFSLYHKKWSNGEWQQVKVEVKV